MKKMGDIGKIITGNTPKTSDPKNYETRSICFVKPSDIAEDKITRILCSEFYISEYAREKARIVPPESVLVTCIGSIGKVAISGIECAINQQINAIIPDSSKCNAEYLAYLLQYKKSELQFMANAPVVPILNKSQFSELSIELPSLDEQKIVNQRLNKITNIISLRQQQLAKLDELVKARFVEIFGDLAAPDCLWLSVRLMDTCENQDAIKCGPFGTQLSKEEYKSDGVAVWEIPQINSQFVSSPTHYLTEEKAKQLQSYSICPGDIAMSRKGNVGKCAVFPKEFEPGIIHSDVLRIRVNQKRVLPVFMMCQLHFSKAVQHQIKLVSSGAIMAGINVTKLKKIYVHIPPMDLQRRFVAFVESVDKTKLSIQNGLEQMEILKKALMQKYFG